MHWDYILLLALLAIVLPWRSTARVRALLEGPPLSSSERLFIYFSTAIFQLLAVGILLWRSLAHQLSAADLGLALPHAGRALLVALLLSTILILNQIYGLRRLAALPREKQGIIADLAEKLLPRNPRESMVAVFLVVAVAICEEFIYRGFVLTVMGNFFSGSSIAAAVISSAFFALAHLYQGKRGLISTFLVGMLFAYRASIRSQKRPDHFAGKCQKILSISKILCTL